MSSLKNTGIIALVAFVMPFLAKAQEQPEGGFDQTQVITGDRSLSVQKAMKISSLPEAYKINVDMGTLSYQMVPRRPIILIGVDSIQPAKVKVREPLEKLYKGFVKAGFGTFVTPYVEGLYTSGRDRDLSYGVHLRHMSANDGINRPVAFSGFNQSQLDGWVKKVYRSHSIQGKVDYQRNGVYYYGFDPQDLDVSKKDIRQTFNVFDLNLDWKSYYRDSSRVNHDIDLDTYFLTDNYESQEFGLKVGADLHAIRGEHFFKLQTSFDFVNTQFSEVTPFDFMEDTTGVFVAGGKQGSGILELAPQILLAKDNLRALVGLSIFGQFTSQAKFNVFPKLEFSYSLFNDIFIPYAGMTGEVNRNSYRNITNSNPFILSSMSLSQDNIAQEVAYDLYGGFRGTLSEKMSFNARVGLSQMNDTPLFVNDTIVSVENRFQVIHDDIRIFSLLGELTYMHSEKWSANLRAEFFGYDTNDEAEAWQMPAFRIDLSGKYNLFDKIEIGAELAWIGKRYAKSYLPVDGIDISDEGYYKVEMDGYVDLTLSVAYNYTKRLSVFVQANNLTASKYDIYYRFPAQRVFVLGGVKYAF